MQPTIDRLLQVRELKLRLVPGPGGDGERGAARRARPISWVHSSDLEDPRGFIPPDALLLTDGAQFVADPEGADFAGYVGRLLEAEVVGLGFATQFLHAGMPAALVAACAEQGLPLLDVPERVPFVSIIRRVADDLAAERTASLERSIQAQRAISLAALRPDGMSAILTALETRLDARVGLFDGAGRAVRTAGARGLDEAVAEAIEPEVRGMLRAARRASSGLEAAGSRVTMQSLGQAGELRGVLAIQHAAPLDRADAGLVTSVIALASLALEQNRALDESRGALRRGILELLLAGAEPVARQTAAPIWGRLPAGPLAVAALETGTAAELRGALDRLVDDSGGAVFHADRADRTIVLAEVEGVPPVLELAARLGRRAGLSSLVESVRLEAGLAEAGRALDRATRLGIPLVRFDELREEGVLGALRRGGGEELAERLLGPLRQADAARGSELESTLRAWLAEGCSWERASAALGIHRHTLRSRVAAASALLGLDLEDFEGRLELWAALELGERDD
ncbi:PucR family transcriptional regulator [Homoserinibacter sp. YIM 151385]|uniref:PucR family transcriptional regulator n=1 Tax=Homoserinibacter sp. YIM 151385 TaxID=2985506 RepID=UPI0022F06711|nr:PucR family transcriptional regulator [Homoserinibacter sp. YIM 151385]WBU38142.1 PucR family transcriptional regulator [Homoserinibacter sp. YIM 151385]